MSSTIDALRAELGAGPLLYRYTGAAKEEAAFVAPSFWAVSALHAVGRTGEARALMDELVPLANDVGVLAEMIDPADGAFLGNLPQGLSHLALIGAALDLEEEPAVFREARRGRRRLTRLSHPVTCVTHPVPPAHPARRARRPTTGCGRRIALSRPRRRNDGYRGQDALPAGKDLDALPDRRSGLGDPVRTIGARTFDFSRQVAVMGIVNRTVDSFYDRGATFALDKAVDAALRAVEHGADWVDVGAVPFSPIAQKVDERAELDRLLPVVEAVRAGTDAVISVDTFRAEVARKALRAGADAVNDTSGLHDPGWRGSSPTRAPTLVVTHSRAAPGQRSSGRATPTWSPRSRRTCSTAPAPRSPRAWRRTAS